MESLFSVASLLTDTLKNEVWFNIAKFPEATFTSTGIVKTDKGYDVSGDLNLRGVAYPLTFPAEITLEGDQLKAKAEFKVLRSAWGMTDTGLLDDVISDDVVVNFDVVGKKS
jgi:polyisoprenoid-binding protein YceI